MNRLFHVVAIAVQFYALFGGLVPPKYAPFIAASIAGLQTAVGELQFRQEPPVKK